ncbi:MAG: hypothetical protein LBJ68_01480 [Endomicrobium sp.]|jgi:dolichol kinase|nr:hypothetical protein [Endomicrobium sp.]
MVNIPKDEIKRKGIHFATLLYVLGYWYFSKTIVISGLILLIAVIAFLEFLRFKIIKLNNFFKTNFKGYYRNEETNKVSGLIGTLSGALLTILMFSNRHIVLASFLYLVFGDSLAALVGKSFGKHRIIFTKKTLEGTLACFFACFFIGIFIFNLQFAFIGAIISAIVEAIPWKINDNFWMQILNALFLTLLSNAICIR